MTDKKNSLHCGKTRCYHQTSDCCTHCVHALLATLLSIPETTHLTSENEGERDIGWHHTILDEKCDDITISPIE